jgi:hypothetical protein
MNIKMPSGRTVVNPFAQDEKPQQVVASADGKEVAVASVDNSNEGVCPKCRGSMGTGIIPQGQVYYCTGCRVTTPIPEDGV